MGPEPRSVIGDIEYEILALAKRMRGPRGVVFLVLAIIILTAIVFAGAFGYWMLTQPAS